MSLIKILILGMSPNKGGIEKSIFDSYKTMNGKEIQIDFLTTHSNIAFENEIIKLGGKVYRVESKKGRKIALYKSYLTFFENHPEYKVIHINRTSLYSVEDILAIKKSGGKRIILHSHASKLSNNKLRSKVAHFVNKIYISKLVDTFLACSEEAAQFMFNKNVLNKKKYKVLKNGIDLNEFTYNIETREKTRKLLDLDGKVVYGHVGAFLPVKNHDFLLKIFEGIFNKEPNSVLILVGDGMGKKNIEKQVYDLKLEKNILFLGAIDNVNEIMQAMDVFLFPSKHEGLGNVVIEAQSTGLQVFTSDTVPSSVDITRLVHHISLRKSSREWTEEIMKKKNLRHREGKENEVKLNGFDLNCSVKELSNVYKDLNNRSIL